MRESTVLGIGVAVVSMLLLLSAVHVYWALGGQLGKGAVLPERNGQPVCRPGAAATVVVAIALLGAAVVLALRAGLLSDLIGGPAVHWASWMVAAAFLLRSIGDFRWVGFFRRERGTRFAYWDARLYTPLAFALGLGAGAIAWGAT
jgi:hypothetical protein